MIVVLVCLQGELSCHSILEERSMPNSWLLVIIYPPSDFFPANVS